MQITPLNHYKQIQPEKRVTFASLHFQKFTVHAMARTIGRGTSTINKVLNRYSAMASKQARARKFFVRPSAAFVPVLSQIFTTKSFFLASFTTCSALDGHTNVSVRSSHLYFRFLPILTDTCPLKKSWTRRH
jgi:hypothetical protein